MFVHGSVGAFDDLRGCFFRLPLSDANGRVYVDFYLRRTGADGDRVFTEHPFLHALSLGFRPGQIAVQHHDELVSTPAADDIAGTGIRAQLLGKLLQKAVARRVPMVVVDLLEVVQVEEYNAKHVLVRDTPLHPLFDVATIRKAGERIPQCELFRCFESGFVV